MKFKCDWYLSLLIIGGRYIFLSALQRYVMNFPNSVERGTWMFNEKNAKASWPLYNGPPEMLHHCKYPPTEDQEAIHEEVQTRVQQTPWHSTMVPTWEEWRCHHFYWEPRKKRSKVLRCLNGDYVSHFTTRDASPSAPQHHWWQLYP